MCKAHAEWGNEVQSLVQQLPDLDHEAIDWDPERCLTVGYISPDLFTHSVSYFAEAPLSHHDSGRYMAFTQYMAFLILQVIIHSAAILALQHKNACNALWKQGETEPSASLKVSEQSNAVVSRTLTLPGKLYTCSGSLYLCYDSCLGL